ncbi:MAG: class I SAM-dependent methyltransferase [Sphingobium sp.]
MASMPDTSLAPFDFWEQLYRGSSPATNGRPSAMLERFVSDQTPGTSLELGCGKGDDCVWLAKRGWHATGIDISATALEYARQNAERNAVAERIDFRQVDLGGGFPDGLYDLVFAMFLETPLEFPRERVLRNAALAVNVGGLLLLVSHGSVAPWSWGDPDRAIPSAHASLAALELDMASWDEVLVDCVERKAKGPGGQTATVSDIIIALERR